ncbi:hypothetical protein [Frankia sp. AgB32]|uniref:hypothetical protein n=1 Tax=Frankia sp. AgB32 TaxID=631119 RepID=UPI00200D157C|nr:hypothetical protein [Frankia sp. AgB32]MCK9895634.1 hypothetical protein [Frankia sp. AgB32]
MAIMGWGKPKKTDTRNTDKRGNTGGGSSTGRSGQKRGGSGQTGDPADAVDRGLMTCPKCSGSTKVGAPAAEADGGGVFDGASQIDCPRCGGTGQVKKK